MRKSILKRLRLYMLSFGVLMGFVFPVYANFFVTFNEGMTVYFVVGCICAGITVGIVSFAFVKVILLKPLLKVSEVATELQNKTIVKRIDIRSDDSVGHIIGGINASGENIKAFLDEMRNVTQINKEILGKITGSDTNTDDSINTIHATIASVTDSADSISSHSAEMCKSIGTGSAAVREWRSRLDEVNGYVETLNCSMTSFVDNAQNINKILESIEDIARRTQLVSVNASIEASSAGVYGKGFNVVALEIRNLANSVSSAAQDIAGYINTINSDIKQSLGSVTEINDRIAKNRDSSKELGDSFVVIDKVANSNYVADKQLRNSVQSLNTSFNAVEAVINDLSKNTESLQAVISQYRC